MTAKFRKSLMQSGVDFKVVDQSTVKLDHTDVNTFERLCRLMHILDGNKVQFRSRVALQSDAIVIKELE